MTKLKYKTTATRTCLLIGELSLDVSGNTSCLYTRNFSSNLYCDHRRLAIALTGHKCAFKAINYLSSNSKAYYHYSSFDYNIESDYNYNSNCSVHNVYQDLNLNSPYDKPDQHFMSVISSTYISSRNKPIFVYLNVSDMNPEVFYDKICTQIPIDYMYTVFLKIRYNTDSFFMAGYLFGFITHLKQSYMIYLQQLILN